MKLTFLMMLMLLSSCVFAQNNTPKSIVVTPKSPNVAAMERYGNYEVNLFHGVPNITIPLFEIKTKGQTVPITLSYHASGIKVTDVASWVGLGWSLNTGGAISRKVKGIMDEQGFLTPDYVFKGPSEIDPRTESGYYHLKSLANGTMDSGPDIYTYSFPGRYGNFTYADKNAPATLIPYEPLKINRKLDPQYTRSFNFQVADEKGSNYIFGRSLAGEEATETSSSQIGGTFKSAVSSWLLTDMVSADLTDTISYKYNDLRSVALSSEYIDYVTINDAVFAGPGGGCGVTSSIYTSGLTSSYNVNQRLMKEILFNNGKVEFLLSPANRNDLNAPALNKINIYTKLKNEYQLLKTVNFFYSYFISQNSSRLKLDSISVKSVDQLSVQTHRFDYEKPTDVPSVNSKSQDYWGYFNGKGNTSLIPSQIVTYMTGNGGGTKVQVGSADREPDPSFVTAGILKRIQFPTGGFTVFDYEPNKFSNILKSHQLGGGVRIKAIYSYPKEGDVPIVKSYMYGTADAPESGSGVINSVKPLSFSSTSTAMYGHIEIERKLILGCTYNSRVFSVSPTISLNDYDDTNVCYPFVTEYTGTKGVNIGKQTFLYSWINDHSITPMMDDRPEVQTLHWQRGKLLEQNEFEAVDRITYKLKRQTINRYNILNARTMNNIGCLVTEVNVHTGPFYESLKYNGTFPLPYSYVFYDVYTGSYQLIESKVRSYDSTVAQEAITKYKYNEYMQPVVIKNTRSTGDTLISRYKYATDYGTYTAVNDAVGILNLSNLNIVSVPIEKTVSVQTASGSEKLLNGQIKSFVNNKPFIKDEYYAETDQPLSNYSTSNIDGSGNLTIPSIFKKRISYTNFDQMGNLTGVLAYPGKKNAYIWGYKKSLIIGEAENANADQVAYSSFEEDGKGNWIYNESAVKELKNSALTGKCVYDFSVGGQITKSNLPVGKYTVTYWAKKPCTVNTEAPVIIGTPNVKGLMLYTHNVTVNNGVITLSSSDALIDELRLYPFNAVMKSYVQLPLVGLVSSDDENDKIQYFDYDGLQRLQNIRDEEGYIVKNYKYNSPASIKLNIVPFYYYNKTVSAEYAKNDCSSDKYGTTVTYSVPEGSYYSTVSFSEVQAKANADLLENGQAYANLHGECRPKDEVIWEPINKYCQVVATGNLDDSLYYSISVANAGNTTDYTTVTLSRLNALNITKVTFELDFGTGRGTVRGSGTFQFDQNSVVLTIGTYPYTNEFRAGGRIVSIETQNKFYFTGYRVYAERQKRIGGQIVLVEPNLKGVGEGPYYEINRDDFEQNCKRGFTTGIPNRAAYANGQLYIDYYKTCPAGYVGSREVYSVEAGKYTSSISQADADAKAKAEADANGQIEADRKGYCIGDGTPPSVVCEGPHKKIINGVCEEANKYYTSSVKKGNTYMCVYRYFYSDGTSEVGGTETGHSAPCDIN